MFVINSTKQEEDGMTLTLNVTFTLQDGTEIILNVPIFQPQSKEDVIQSLINREASEQVKYDTLPVNLSIKKELDETVVGKVIGE